MYFKTLMINRLALKHNALILYTDSEKFVVYPPPPPPMFPYYISQDVILRSDKLYFDSHVYWTIGKGVTGDFF